MKKPISILLILMIFICTLSGCAVSQNANSGKLSVVATVFCEYDWLMNILGDNTESTDVTLLLNNGVDMHSYQPTADDIIKISKCDIFIYVGGESDKWVDDALKNATNKNMTVINLLDILGDSAKKEEPVEGMEKSAEDEYDEHVWLSLKNTIIFVDAIRDALIKANPQNTDNYTKNAEAYKDKLKALDGEYKATVDNSSVKTLLFGDRFPFRYLTDDYGITYYAAFSGCSAESDASFETVKFLAEKLTELNLPAVLIIDGSDGKIADAIIKASVKKDTPVLSMNSMQATTFDDIKNGTSYLSIMKDNLDILKTALK